MNFKMRKNKWSSPDCFLDFTMICFSKRIPRYISFFLFLFYIVIYLHGYIFYFSLYDKSKLCDLCKSFISFILYTFIDIKNFWLFFFLVYTGYIHVFFKIYFIFIWFDFLIFFFWRGGWGGGRYQWIEVNELVVCTNVTTGWSPLGWLAEVIKL